MESPVCQAAVRTSRREKESGFISGGNFSSATALLLFQPIRWQQVQQVYSADSITPV